MSKSEQNKKYYEKNKQSHSKRMCEYYHNNKKESYCETCMKSFKSQTMATHCQSAYHIKRQQIDDKLDTLNILEENI